jgi:nicotinate-nucleotide pyrophosphorylase (carboxylating)
MNQQIEEIVTLVLREDVGTGDVTTESTVSADRTGVGRIVAKSEGVIAGLPVVEEVFRQVDGALSVRRLVEEGERVHPGDVACEVSGSARSILIGERVALNFLQRLSGIATLTSEFVTIVSGARASREPGSAGASRSQLPVRIVDTRKTTPGLRVLEKYAVTVGGGYNHRMGLYDAVMVKDNHIVAAGGILPAVRAARAAIPHTMTITVECETLEQVDEALEAGADVLLLDNMTNEMRAEAVARVSGRALTEASGGITLETAAAIAATGVDILSIGALTHSAPALDISLDLELT